MSVETALPDRHADAMADSHQMGFWPLALGSIGVVYGDIGTSPIYAFREAVHAGSQQAGVNRDIVIAVLSLIIWALILVVTVKYVVLLLRADNRGEGGTLSLMALAHKALGRRSGTKVSTVVFIMGVAAASLFFGDAMITPAISVLSAVEGLEVVALGLRRVRVADHRRDPDRAVRRCRAAARSGWRAGSARSRPCGSSFSG